MPHASRRLILLPDGLPAADVAKLADALARAVDAQRKLAAKSPHILDLTGDLQRTEQGFFIDHEPAAPLDVPGLFRSAAKPTPEATLIDVAAALFRALAAAHSSAAGRPTVHGGLCPGTLVTDENGVWKITDFGFAPAVCNALGIQAYLNLAVAPPADDPLVSAAWSILAPDEVERDDRLCGFIDPEKYGAQLAQGDKMLASFEPGSDLIAAAFILHLMAEHHHPYFYSDPEAHRVIEMSQMMAMGAPTAARRKDLRDAPVGSPAIVWCAAVARALSRVPTDRPPAAELAQRFDGIVPVIDAEAIAKGRDRVKAEKWLAEVEPLAAAQEWDELEPRLSSAPDLAHWPAEVAARRDAMLTQLTAHRKQQARLAELKVRADAARAWLEKLRPLVAAKEWDAARESVRTAPPLDDCPADLQKEAAALKTQITESLARIALERAVAADHDQARQWYDELARAVGESRWSDASSVLLRKPTLTHWPDDVLENAPLYVEQVNRQVEAIEAERRRMEEEHFQALDWLSRCEAQADKNRWEEVLNLVSEPPRLEHWPAGVRESAAKLRQRARFELGDEIRDLLDAQTALIEKLARAFVEKCLAEKLAALLDPRHVSVAIDAVEWASDHPSANARAHLTARLVHPAAPKDAPGIRLPCDVQTELTPRVLDDDGKIAARIIDHLSQQLLPLQQAAVPALTAAVKGPLFPNAALAADCKKLSAAVTAQVAPRGPKDAADAFTTPLRWDPRDLKWTIADASDLTTKLTALAARDARAAALPKITAVSEPLRRCQKLLSLDLTPVAAAPVTPLTSVRLHGPLTLRTGPNAAPHQLQSVAFTYSGGGRLTLEGDLAAAESALAALVVAAQNTSRQGINDELDRRAADSGLKVRVTPAPKKTKQPTPEITFDVSVKTGGQLTITGTWNDEAFVYQVPKTALETLGRLLAPPEPEKPKPPPEPVRPAVAPAPTPAAPPTKSAEPPSKPPAPPPAAPPKPAPPKKAEPAQPAAGAPPKKRGLLIGGGVVAVAAIIGIVFMFSRPSPPKPEPKPTPPPIVDTTPKPPPIEPATRPVTPPTPRAPTKLAIAPIVGPIAGAPFDVTVNSLDDRNAPLDATKDLAVTLSVATGNGKLTGPITATLKAGTNSVTLSNLSYDKPESDVVLSASTPDAALAAARSPAFTVAPAPIKPPPTPIEPDLAALLKSQWPELDATKRTHPPLRDFLTKLLPAAARGEAAGAFDFLGAVAEPDLTVDSVDSSSKNDRAFKVAVALKPDKSAQTGTFQLRFDTDKWVPTDANKPALLALADAAKRTLLKQAGDLDAEATTHIAAGKLARARAALTELDKRTTGWDQLAFVSQSERTAATASLAWRRRLPPEFQSPAGYRAGPADPDVGYPASLSADPGGVRLLRVNVPPTDPLWTALAALPPANPGALTASLLAEARKPADQRAWRLFYIEAAEFSVPPSASNAPIPTTQSANGKAIVLADSFTRAASFARQVNRELPTTDEWLLASLKLRSVADAMDFLGSAYEWCENSSSASADDGTHWAVGGCSLLAGRFKGKLTPPPPTGAAGDVSAWLSWMDNPLVSQVRTQGDRLTSFRTVLRIGK